MIRWAFEQQGEYQVPLITTGGPGDGSVASPGDAPGTDVYVDDGRGGEYPYQVSHWNTTTIWSRHAADGLAGRQEPILSEPNYADVKVKNRGTQTAQNVVVKGYHTKPGAGLLWPGDFEAFTTPQVAVGTVGPNDGEEVLVGPFEWTLNLDPAIRMPINHGKGGRGKRDCIDKAQALIDCLGVCGPKVDRATIKEIVVGVKMRDDACCD